VEVETPVEVNEVEVERQAEPELVDDSDGDLAEPHEHLAEAPEDSLLECVSTCVLALCRLLSRWLPSLSLVSRFLSRCLPSLDVPVLCLACCVCVFMCVCAYLCLYICVYTHTPLYHIVYSCMTSLSGNI
jgi:hypothetical protein